MKYKMLVTDIDDTLLNSQKQITPKTKSALIKAQERGVVLTIASGRLPYGVEPYARELEILDRGGFFISFNGGEVIDPKNNSVFSTCLDSSYLGIVCEMLRDTDLNVSVHKNDSMYADKKLNRYTFYEQDAIGLPLNQVDDLASFVDWDLHKILIAGEPDEIKAAERLMLSRFGKELDIYLSAPWFLEIMPKGVSKLTGVELIASKLDISLSEVIACGDSFNDMSMIKAVGLGVAMKNAEEGLKAAADYVTENDCDNDGLAEVVERFLFDN